LQRLNVKILGSTCHLNSIQSTFNNNNLFDIFFQFQEKSIYQSLSFFFDNSLAGKSLPIHCVIEVNDNGSQSNNITSSRVSDRPSGCKNETSGSGSCGGGVSGNNVSSSSGGNGGEWKSQTLINECKKMFYQNKMSCNIVYQFMKSNWKFEQISDLPYMFLISASLTGGVKIIEVDDFVIVPVGTPFQDVVTTVLTLLGYPKDTIQQAEGIYFVIKYNCFLPVKVK
jgi:SATB (special AT-rich sequence-binding)-like protein